jgi:hypothetical protein
MKQNPSGKANNPSASQEILCIKNAELNYRLKHSSPLVPIQSYFAHTNPPPPKSRLLEIHFNFNPTPTRIPNHGSTNL